MCFAPIPVVRLLEKEWVDGIIATPPAPPPEDERSSENSLCVICLDNPKTHIFTGCFHKCLCAGCAEIMKKKEEESRKCPICRNVSTDIAFVYE
jgi:hypothetical protein